MLKNKHGFLFVVCALRRQFSFEQNKYRLSFVGCALRKFCLILVSFFVFMCSFVLFVVISCCFVCFRCFCVFYVLQFYFCKYLCFVVKHMPFVCLWLCLAVVVLFLYVDFNVFCFVVIVCDICFCYVFQFFCCIMCLFVRLLFFLSWWFSFLLVFFDVMWFVSFSSAGHKQKKQTVVFQKYCLRRAPTLKKTREFSKNTKTYIHKTNASAGHKQQTTNREDSTKHTKTTQTTKKLTIT